MSRREVRLAVQTATVWWRSVEAMVLPAFLAIPLALVPSFGLFLGLGLMARSSARA